MADERPTRLGRLLHLLARIRRGSFRCGTCGTDEIQTHAWKWMNTGAAVPGEGPGSPELGSTHWCPHCRQHPRVLISPTGERYEYDDV